MTDMTVERSRLQIAVLAILAVYVVLFGILTAVSRHRPGIVFREALLRMEETGEGLLFSGRAAGQPVTVLRTEEPSGAVNVELTAGDFYHGVGRVEPDPEAAPRNPEAAGVAVFLDGREIFRGGYYKSGDIQMLLTSDGEPEWSVDVTASGIYDHPWENYEPGAGTILNLAYDRPDTHRGSWLCYFLAVFYTLAVALDVAFPLALFRLKYMFSVRDPEPTEFYMAMQKAAWIFLTGALPVCYILALRVLE